MKIKLIETKTYETEVHTKDRDTAINAATDMVRNGWLDPLTCSIEVVNDFKQIPSDLAEDILNKVIDYTAIGRDRSAAIQELLKMGFPPEALCDYFGFNLLDVADELEEEEAE